MRLRGDVWLLWIDADMLMDEFLLKGQLKSWKKIDLIIGVRHILRI